MLEDFDAKTKEEDEAQRYVNWYYNEEEDHGTTRKNSKTFYI
jgi:hypothetical protein